MKSTVTVSLDPDRRGDRHTAVERDAVVVHVVREAVHAVGDLRDTGAGESLRIVEKTVEIVVGGGAVVLVERLEPIPPHRGGRDLRADVAHHHPREAHVAADDPDESLVEGPRVVELERRQDEPLLEDLGRIRRHAARHLASEVLLVGEAHRKADGTAGGEDRHRDDEIGQMGAAVVRIVHRVDVALAAVGGRKRFEQTRHRGDEGGHVLRQRDRLREEVTARVEQRRGAVLPFLENDRVGAPEQRRLDLSRDAVEAVADHLQRDRVETFHDAPPACVTTRLPAASAAARWPG